MTYGQLIKNRREARNWSQVEFAERVGVSPATVSNWEREVTPPGIDDVNKLCMGLSISAETLLTAMGVNLTPPLAARIPRALILALLELQELAPERLEQIEYTAQAVAQAVRREPPQAPR